jgi:hypothetical protein
MCNNKKTSWTCGSGPLPVKETFVLRRSERSSHTKKAFDPVKVRFLFFRQAIKMGLLNNPRLIAGRGWWRARILYDTSVQGISPRRNVGFVIQ